MLLSTRPLVLGLIVALILKLVDADIRARDPEVEEEPHHANAWERVLYGAHGNSLHRGPQRHTQHPLQHGNPGSHAHNKAVEMAPPSADTETQHSSTRIGNWCSYISYRMDTTTVTHGSEKYTIKSQSPCPNGTPDCYLVMYKLSERPVYREVPKIVSSQLWRCCPGHGGKNCENTVAQGHVLDTNNHTRSFHPVVSEVHHRADERQASQLSAEHLERHEFQASEQFKEENNTSLSPDHVHPDTVHHLGPDHDHDHHKTGPKEADPSLHSLPFPYGEPLSLSHIETMLMARLQPLLDDFNQSLQRLSQEVRNLSWDLAELKHSLAEPRVVEEPIDYSGKFEALEARLTETFQHINKTCLLLSSRQDKMEDRLHSQQAMVHYNLTNFKMDTDSKIKRGQKTMQVSLQHLNASLAEVRMDHVRLEEEVQRGTKERGNSRASQPQETTTVWEAINRLDNKVINNTVEVGGLLEDLDKVRKNINSIQNECRALTESVTKDGRDLKVQNMLNGLEIEDLKTKLWNRMSELAGNVTEHETELREMNVDIDYLFHQFHKNVSSAADDYSAFKSSLSKLEQDVAKVSELVNENRLTVEDTSSTLGTWNTNLDDLSADLQLVLKTQHLEQEKSHSLHHNLSQLRSDLLGDIHSLQAKDTQKEARINQLSSFFKSLLMDTLRHSKVLEILLGEEVLQFTDQPKDKQNTYSIPVLKKKLHTMQDDIKNQNLILQSFKISVQSEDPGTVYEPLVPLQEFTKDLKRESRDHRGDLTHPSDNNLHSLEKALAGLEDELSRLEHKCCLSCCNCTDKTDPMGLMVELQAEVAVMRAALQEHLHIFKNMFSNMDVLASTDETLDLDKLRVMIKEKGERRLGKSNQEKKGQRKGNQNRKKMGLQGRRDNSPESKEKK